jgi:S-sulfo-L-cysteine synthase (3-phospho-L-serine-dependent)
LCELLWLSLVAYLARKNADPGRLMKAIDKRVGIIHAYPSNYLVNTLKKSNCKIVLFVPEKSKLSLNDANIEEVIELPLHNHALVHESIIEYHQNKPLDVLLPIYEGATSITAKLAEFLKLRGAKFSAAEASRNKYLSYNYWLQNSIPVPLTVPIYNPYLGWQEIEANIGYPAIIKLVDSMNSQGIIKVANRHEYLNAIERLLQMLQRPFDLSQQVDRNRLAYGTSDIKIIAQQYCSGVEVGVDCIVSNGSYQIFGVFEKTPAKGPYFAESMSISPTSLNDEELQRVKQIAIDAVTVLGHDQTTAAHVEIRFTEDGPKVLEAGLRPGGAYTVAAVEYMTGINPYLELLNALLGNNLNFVSSNTNAVLYGGIVIPKSGYLTNVSGLEVFEDMPGLLDVQILNASGDQVYSLPESAQPHFAYYLVGGTSRYEILHKHKAIQESICLEIEDFIDVA